MRKAENVAEERPVGIGIRRVQKHVRSSDHAAVLLPSPASYGAPRLTQLGNPF
jgi:hypothetical protein